MENEREGKGREGKGVETLPLTRKLNVNKRKTNFYSGRLMSAGHTGHHR